MAISDEEKGCDLWIMELHSPTRRVRARTDK